MQKITYLNGFGEEVISVILARFIHDMKTWYVVKDRIGKPILITEDDEVQS